MLNTWWSLVEAVVVVGTEAAAAAVQVDFGQRLVWLLLRGLL
jgi:hypothetical protein